MHTQWAIDLVRLEIALWERLDVRLRERHELSLAFFEALYFVARAPGGSTRVGDLADALKVTIGGTSKLVDRIEGAGLIARGPDPDDRRASRLTLTAAGARVLKDATSTYETELAAFVDPVLTTSEQRQMHSFVTRLLDAGRERA